MSDLIKRQDAIDALLEEVRLVDGYYVENDEMINKDDAIEAIRLLPTVEERPTAKWITNEFPNKNNCYYIQCSRCGKPAIWTNGISYYPPNFCPNCGADMRGKQDENR